MLGEGAAARKMERATRWVAHTKRNTDTCAFVRERGGGGVGGGGGWRGEERHMVVGGEGEVARDGAVVGNGRGEWGRGANDATRKPLGNGKTQSG